MLLWKQKTRFSQSSCHLLFSNSSLSISSPAPTKRASEAKLVLPTVWMEPTAVLKQTALFVRSSHIIKDTSQPLIGSWERYRYNTLTPHQTLWIHELTGMKGYEWGVVEECRGRYTDLCWLCGVYVYVCESVFGAVHLFNSCSPLQSLKEKL